MNTPPPPKMPLGAPEGDDDNGATGGGGRADGSAGGDGLEGLTFGLHQGFPSDLSIDKTGYAAVLGFLGHWVNPIAAEALYSNGLGAELAWQAEIANRAAGGHNGLRWDDPLLELCPVDFGDDGHDDEEDAVRCDEGDTNLESLDNLPDVLAPRYVAAPRTISVAEVHAAFDELDAAAITLVRRSVDGRGLGLRG